MDTTTSRGAARLARAWAEHFGYKGKPGGWIYDDNGRPVVQGWAGLAQRLIARGYIEPGVGVHWRRVDLTKQQSPRRWRP